MAAGGMGGGMGGGLLNLFGGIMDFAGNEVKNKNQQNLAYQQQDRANSLTAQSNNTVAPALQSEFMKALQGRQMLAAQGTPDLQSYSNQLDQHLANSLAAAKSVGNGDQLLASLSSLGANNMQGHLQLDQQDAAARQQNQGNLLNTYWQIGAEKDRNDAIKRQMQQRLDAASAAQQNASTANLYMAKNKHVDNTTGLGASMLNTMGGMMGGGTDHKGTADSQTSAPASMPNNDTPWNGQYADTGANSGGMMMDKTNMTGDQEMTGLDSSGSSIGMGGGSGGWGMGGFSGGM